MSERWTAEVQDAAASAVARHIGLHFPEDRAADLRRGLELAAPRLGFDTTASCVRWLACAALSPSQVEALAECLTVGETYFFRDPNAFAALTRQVVPALAKISGAESRRLRIWSAGCCTGEEAYSIAIALHSGLPALRHWRFEVLGTDLSEQYLERARSGLYGEWSFRNALRGDLQDYFRRDGDKSWRVVPEVRQTVEFRQLNLVTDDYTHAVGVERFDVIFCRNVLMYFELATAARVAGQLANLLRVGGQLVLSPGEAMIARTAGLQAVDHGEAVFYTRSAPAPKVEVQKAVVQAAPRCEEAAAAIVPPPFRRQSPITEPKPTEEGLGLKLSDLLEKAKSLADQGRLGESIACCAEATRAYPLDAEALYFQGLVLQESGDIEAAAQSYRRAVFIDPGYVVAHFARGNAAALRARSDEAKRHYANALALARQMPDGQILEGSDGLTAGRLVEFVDHLLNHDSEVLAS